MQIDSPVIIGTLTGTASFSISSSAAGSSTTSLTASFIESQEWSSNSTITIGATTTAPTKGTIVYDRVRYRQINSTTYEVDYNYAQSTTGTAGSGDYLFSLPGGLTWGAGVTVTTLTTDEAKINRAIAAAGIFGDTSGRFRTLAVSPYSTTQFRLLIQDNTLSQQTMGGTAVGLDLDGISFKLRFYTTA